MKSDLYYCKPWSYRYYKRYITCVSDFVEEHNLIQIHCAAFTSLPKGELRVVRGYATKDLEIFEGNVRKNVRSFIDAVDYDDYFEKHTVKIWYYNPDDRSIDTNDIPLRMAITFYRPARLKGSEKEVHELKEPIYNELFRLLDKH